MVKINIIKQDEGFFANLVQDGKPLASVGPDCKTPAEAVGNLLLFYSQIKFADEIGVAFTCFDMTKSNVYVPLCDFFDSHTL